VEGTEDEEDAEEEETDDVFPAVLTASRAGVPRFLPLIRTCIMDDMDIKTHTIVFG